MAGHKASDEQVDGNIIVVRSIRNVPVTEERKPYMSKSGAKLQHTGTSQVRVFHYKER